MYVYIQSEPRLHTVGFYDPQGKWHSESDHSSREKAAERVYWLNGGGGDTSSLVTALELAATRFDLLVGRFRGCLSDKRHELSITEGIEFARGARDSAKGGL